MMAATPSFGRVSEEHPAAVYQRLTNVASANTFQRLSSPAAKSTPQLTLPTAPGSPGAGEYDRGPSARTGSSSPLAATSHSTGKNSPHTATAHSTGSSSPLAPTAHSSGDSCLPTAAITGKQRLGEALHDRIVRRAQDCGGSSSSSSPQRLLHRSSSPGIGGNADCSYPVPPADLSPERRRTPSVPPPSRNGLREFLRGGGQPPPSRDGGYFGRSHTPAGTTLSGPLPATAKDCGRATQSRDGYSLWGAQHLGGLRSRMGTRGSISSKQLDFQRCKSDVPDKVKFESDSEQHFPPPQQQQQQQPSPPPLKQLLPAVSVNKTRFSSLILPKEISSGHPSLDAAGDASVDLSIFGEDGRAQSPRDKGWQMVEEEATMLRKAVHLGVCKGERGGPMGSPSLLRRGRSFPADDLSPSPPTRPVRSPLPWEDQGSGSQSMPVSPLGHSSTMTSLLQHCGIAHSATAPAELVSITPVSCGSGGAGAAATSPRQAGQTNGNGGRPPTAGAGGDGAAPATAAVSWGLGAAAAAAMAKGNTSVMHSLGVRFKVLKQLATASDVLATTDEVVNAIVLPATHARKCRYIDLVAEKDKGPPGFYVIHAWAASFQQLVTSLELYMSDNRIRLEDACIWIDLACSNLRKLQTKDNIARCKELIDQTEKVLLCLDSEGICLGRSWPQFELWQTFSRSRGGEHLSVLYNPGWDWERCAHMFSSIQMRESAASQPSDTNALLSEVSRTVDMVVFPSSMRRQLRFASSQDMQRTQKLANVNPLPHIRTSLTRAAFQIMALRIHDAEETLKKLLVLCNKSKFQVDDGMDREIVLVMITLAKVQRMLGKISEPESVLQTMLAMFQGMTEELYLDGKLMLANVLMVRKQYTKAEMMCHKIIEEREAAHHDRGTVVPTLLQMADIALAQRLHDEAGEYLEEALEACEHLRKDNPDWGRVKHKIAVTLFKNIFDDRVMPAIEDALQTRTAILGFDHTETSETRMLEVEFLFQTAVSQSDPQRSALMEDVVEKLMLIHKARVVAYGAEHYSSLEVWGRMSDVYYEMDNAKEGLAMEKKVLEVGRLMLRHTQAEKFNSLFWISSFLVKREHLLTSAALFLARAFQVYKNKLGVDHPVTLQTRSQLTDLAGTIKMEAQGALHEAQNFPGSDQQAMFSHAELLYKQALQVSKLVNSVETEHKEIARGLSDALFGQGKMHEGKKVMATHGLAAFEGGKTPMPASYVRWFNKRVTNFLQQQTDEAEAKEMAARAARGDAGMDGDSGNLLDGLPNITDSDSDEDFFS